MNPAFRQRLFQELIRAGFTIDKIAAALDAVDRAARKKSAKKSKCRRTDRPELSE